MPFLLIGSVTATGTEVFAGTEAEIDGDAAVKAPVEPMRASSPTGLVNTVSVTLIASAKVTVTVFGPLITAVAVLFDVVVVSVQSCDD